jgi:hypothetical protein
MAANIDLFPPYCLTIDLASAMLNVLRQPDRIAYQGDAVVAFSGVR